MPKTRKSHDRIDVSGDVDERGRLVNKDVPEEARRGSKVRKKKREDKLSAKIAAVSDEPKKKKRRKKEVEEELPKKKKKKSKLETTPASSKAIAKLEKRKGKLERDMMFLPAEGGANDEFDQQYRAMFEKLREITEIFEENMLSGNPNGRDVYALSTLYSQMREVIADMRSAKDVTAQIAELESKAYGAFLQNVGQSFVSTLFKMQKDIRTFVKDREAQAQLLASLEGVVKDETDKVMGHYQIMLERVRTVLT